MSLQSYFKMAKLDSSSEISEEYTQFNNQNEVPGASFIIESEYTVDNLSEFDNDISDSKIRVFFGDDEDDDYKDSSTTTYHTDCLNIDLPQIPHHPTNIKFPSRQYGTRHRTFQQAWFVTRPRLHYIEGRDATLCLFCTKAEQDGHLLSNRNKERTFITKGFSNWKKATEGFRKHEQSMCHKNAVSMMVTSGNDNNISDMISSGLAGEKEAKMLIKIL